MGLQFETKPLDARKGRVRDGREILIQTTQACQVIVELCHVGAGRGRWERKLRALFVPERRSAIKIPGGHLLGNTAAPQNNCVNNGQVANLSIPVWLIEARAYAWMVALSSSWKLDESFRFAHHNGGDLSGPSTRASGLG